MHPPTMSNKQTQTSLSGTDFESADDSASMRTLFGDAGTYHVSAPMEANKRQVNGSVDAVSNEKESAIVDWSGPNDPENPQNFPRWRKWTITIMLGLMTICVTFASSVFSTATKVTGKKFHVSSEVMVLAVSLFVLGFAFGPVIFGPLSELHGRKKLLFVGMFIFYIFQIPVAVAQNLQTIFICRFLGGVFASAPLAIVSGVLGDMFEPVERGIAMSIFAGATFVGPVAGPIVGGFVVMSFLSWRWTEQRVETGNWALHARAEEKVVSLRDIMTRYILRPFQMLALEPILLLVTLYIGFIYGFLYITFVAYPISFQEQRGWDEGIGSVSPEERLIPMAIGGIFLPIGMFWFGWTSSPHISWVPQVISGSFLGAGVLLIFLQVCSSQI
ncbi:unnamed protein product [Penicillium salamii]|uniref:Major facilitator superfamily (MFS) profile domain-containing protein n=1 Tax=Penicillium salamii TaxID=1612424 RepID=A0A9W4NVY3_9EURO|nr:unnamed protein product [Penicillium salamii]